MKKLIAVLGIFFGIVLLAMGIFMGYLTLEDMRHKPRVTETGLKTYDIEVILDDDLSNWELVEIKDLSGTLIGTFKGRNIDNDYYDREEIIISSVTSYTDDWNPEVELDIQNKLGEGIDSWDFLESSIVDIGGQKYVQLVIDIYDNQGVRSLTQRKFITNLGEGTGKGYEITITTDTEERARELVKDIVIKE